MLKIYHDFLPIENYEREKRTIKYKLGYLLKKLPNCIRQAYRNYKIKKKEKYLSRKISFISFKYIEFFKKNGYWPLPETVFIETINKCNNTCSFCPANKFFDRRKFEKMDIETFKRILEQLKILKYQGEITLSLNNEPFLDDRIIEFAKLTRERFPLNSIYLYTNGSLLSIEKFVAIMPYLNSIRIDNYNDEYHFLKPIKVIKEFVEANPQQFIDKDIHIYLRRLNQQLSTRAGTAPNIDIVCNKVYNDFGCMAPFQQIAIRPSGKISMCCSDAMGDMTLGDLKTDSLYDIWNGKCFTEIRNNLINDRQKINLCKKCDFVWYKEVDF